jgi:hypothetical protein
MPASSDSRTPHLSASPVLNYRSSPIEPAPLRVEAIAAERADAVRDLIGWSVVLIAVVALLGIAWTMAHT